MTPSTQFEPRAAGAEGSARAAWVRPGIRRLDAGAAEAGGGGNPDIGVSQS